MTCNTAPEVDAAIQDARQTIIVDSEEFEINNSLPAAKRLAAAYRKLIALLVQRHQMGGASGESLQHQIAILRDERRDLRKWIQASEANRGSQIIMGRTCHDA